MYRRSFFFFYLLLAAFSTYLIPSTAVGGSLGQGCSAFAPCNSGLTCQPGVHKCYNSPRREGQPCSLGFECKAGLSCEAGSQVCRGRGSVGDACHATRPCGSGLTCQPGVHKCYNTPRLENQPCSAGFPCSNGLKCEAGAQICRKPGGLGEACHATRPCAQGLACQAFSQRCFPGDFSWDNRNSCLSVRDDAIAKEAKRSGITTTYGAGSAQTAFMISMSEEIGVAYGSRGEYGCYNTVCGGFVSDLSISAYGAVGEFDSYSSIAGDAEVYSGGASPPILEVGGGSIAIVVARDFNDPSVPHKVVGSVQTLGIGLGVLPGQASALKCHTNVNDVLGVNGVPVSNEVLSGENLDCVKQAFERLNDWENAFQECRTNKITAALTLYNGATYLFHPNGTYSRMSKGKTRIDLGYPTKMPGGWKGLPSTWHSSISAALPYKGSEKSYMFRNAEYARLKVVTVDSGYPTRMPGGWQGIPSSWNGQVDAALHYQPNSKHYMFKGNQYIRLTGTKVDSGYPTTLPGEWKGMPTEFTDGIDAATYRNGHVYMFKGDKYIRFKGMAIESGYPKSTQDNW